MSNPTPARRWLLVNGTAHAYELGATLSRTPVCRTGPTLPASFPLDAALEASPMALHCEACLTNAAGDLRANLYREVAERIEGIVAARPVLFAALMGFVTFPREDTLPMLRRITRLEQADVQDLLTADDDYFARWITYVMPTVLGTRISQARGEPPPVPFTGKDVLRYHAPGLSSLEFAMPTAVREHAERIARDAGMS